MNTVMVVQPRFLTAGLVSQANLNTQSSNSTTPFVRRPTRGLQIKQDTFATIRLVAGISGQNIPLVDAGSRRTNGSGQPIQIGTMRATDIYSNFLLQHVHEDRMEKSQVLETFGEPYIFLFGERPRIITFSGILMNSYDFNWEAEWWYNYDNYLRGTQAVNNDARAFISYDTTVASGYIISASADKSPAEPYYVQFQFQLFLTDYSNVQNLGNPNAQSAASLGATLVTSEAQAAAFLPTELPPDTDAQLQQYYIDMANNNPVSLAQSFEAAVDTVSSAWNSAQTVANNALAGVAGMLNGDVVRVPIGFAGAMEFDTSETPAILVSPQYGQATVFGTYSQNDDEFVGSGSQYGSSVGPGGIFPVFLDPYSPEVTNLGYTQAMLDSAVSQWTQIAPNIPIASPDPLGPVANLILGKGLGLMLAASGQALVNAASQAAVSDRAPGGAAAPPFGTQLGAASFLPL